MYRELAYVERCACDQPAVAGCDSCGRARCAYHLNRGLCMRCTEAIRRELVKRSATRFAGSMTTGVVIALAFLIVHSGVGIVVGVPAAIAAFFAMARLQRRLLIKRMGPSLAAMRGELPSAREVDPVLNTTTGGPPVSETG